MRLAETSGARTAKGIQVTLPFSNQELASQIGTVRELVSRNLSRFQGEGLIQLDGRNLLIPSLKSLQAELDCLQRFRDYIAAAGLLTASRLNEIDAEIEAEVRQTGTDRTAALEKPFMIALQRRLGEQT